MTLLWITVAGVLLAIVAHALTLFQLAKLRRAGMYPRRGKATMADVERLLATGLRVGAMRCYREVHQCSLRQAREAVDLLAPEQ
jgi:hypothetical protein